MKIAIGSDHSGVTIKKNLIEALTEKGYECKDFGAFSEQSCDYPDYAYPVTKAVVNDEFQYGILICGTGIGMCMASNKVKGARCALCDCVENAVITRKHNNANVLAVGARTTPESTIKAIVQAFLTTEFEGERHQRRIDKITKIEEGKADD